jgi:hypothetical protein
MYFYIGFAARSFVQIASGHVEAGNAQRIFFWTGIVATIVVAIIITRIARRALEEKISTQ